MVDGKPVFPTPLPCYPVWLTIIGEALEHLYVVFDGMVPEMATPWNGVFLLLEMVIKPWL
jgi:hypothetical protein